MSIELIDEMEEVYDVDYAKCDGRLRKLKADIHWDTLCWTDGAVDLEEVCWDACFDKTPKELLGEEWGDDGEAVHNLLAYYIVCRLLACGAEVEPEDVKRAMDGCGLDGTLCEAYAEFKGKLGL